MGEPNKDYGHFLWEYAYKLIKDDVGVEFDKNLNEWKIYTNNLVLYARYAFANFQNVLERAQKEMESRRQIGQQFAMFALSMLAGPAISYISGSLQYRLAPKLFGKMKVPKGPEYVKPAGTSTPIPAPRKPAPLPQSVKIPTPSRYGRGGPPAVRPMRSPGPPKPQPNLQPKLPDIRVPAKIPQPTYIEDAGSKIKGKILGDFGGSLIKEFGLHPAIRAVEPNQAKLQAAVSATADSLTLEALATNLENVWLEAQSVGREAMQHYANTFYKDTNWGDRLWADLVAGKFAGAQFGPGHELDLFERGKRYVEGLVNKQRRQWAADPDWFYYGNAPAPITQPQAVNAIEAEMWALWITQEDLKLHYKMAKTGDEAAMVYRWIEVSGNSGLLFNADIFPRLRELGVIEGSQQMEAVRRTAQKGTDSGLLPIEVNDIVGELDTEREVQSIRSWAANRKPIIFGGQLGSVRRPMEDIVL